MESRLEKMPSPEKFETYDDFCRESQKWANALQESNRFVIFPVPFSINFTRPSSNSDKIILPRYKSAITISYPSRFQFQVSLLSDDPIQPDIFFQDASHRPLSSSFLSAIYPRDCWKTQLVPLAPNPEFYSDFSKYEKAAINWEREVLKIRSIPSHPSSFIEVISGRSLREDKCKKSQFFMKAEDDRAQKIDLRFQQKRNIREEDAPSFSKSLTRLLNDMFPIYTEPEQSQVCFIKNDPITPKSYFNEMKDFGYIIGNPVFTPISKISPLLSDKYQNKNLIYAVMQEEISESPTYKLQLFNFVTAQMVYEDNRIFSVLQQDSGLICCCIDAFSLFIPRQIPYVSKYMPLLSKMQSSDQTVPYIMRTVLTLYLTRAIHLHIPDSSYIECYFEESELEVKSLLASCGQQIADFFESKNDDLTTHIFIDFLIIGAICDLPIAKYILSKFKPDIFSFLNTFSNSRGMAIRQLGLQVLFSPNLTSALFPFLCAFCSNILAGSMVEISDELLGLIDNMLKIKADIVSFSDFEWCQGLSTYLKQCPDNPNHAYVINDLCSFISRYSRTKQMQTIIPEVVYIMDLLIGPISVHPNTQKLIFRGFATLLRIPSSRPFVEERIRWMPLILKQMGNANPSISSECWRIFRVFFVNHLSDSFNILESRKCQLLILKALDSPHLYSLLEVFKLIYQLAERHTEADSPGSPQKNVAGLIFALPGIPTEIVEFASILCESGFRLSDSMERASQLARPSDIGQMKEVFGELYRVHRSHSACIRLFNGQIIGKKKKAAD